ncbi:MAG TPA: homoserine dehydrogenase [Burkholderiaceae bacterium]|nr:homoserine dehydrogenase [Burkholderiaceae bacterium]
MFNDPDLSPLAALGGGADLRPLRALRVGMIGIGTVGAGTWRVLRRNQAPIRGRAGRGIEIVALAARNLVRAAAIVGDADVELTDDPLYLASHPGIDVVVEVAGGTGAAREWVLRAIAHGKHVVTANKALLAEHGHEIFAAAQRHGVTVAYEGAVAVSIPIVKALREGLAANEIEWVAGIVNGTTNFILSKMRDEGLDFATALAQAQALGYAEADPTFDIEGIDAAHKITLLAANAFGTPVRFAQVQTEGIQNLQALDIACAERLGFRVKLLGIARRRAAGLELRVHPALVPAKHLLAQVDGAMNGIFVKGDASGLTMYYGAGAGAEQTASAVIADLVDLARLHGAPNAQRVPHLAFHPEALRELPVLPPTDVCTRHYLRVPIAPGAQGQAAVLQVLHECGVPVQSLCHEREDEAADAPHNLVVLTHETPESAVAQALSRLALTTGVAGAVTRLRVEMLE